MSRLFDQLRPWAHIAAGALIGYAAWGRGIAWLPFAALLPLVWAHAPTRTNAWTLVLAYYAVSSRGLIDGTQIFFGTTAPPYLGALFCLASAAVLAAPWFLFWTPATPTSSKRLKDALSPDLKIRTIKILALIGFTILPPIAIIGWTHPLTAAGALFPGLGLIGLILTVLLFIAMSAVRLRHAYLPLACLIGASAYGHVVNPPVPVPAHIDGHDTNLGGLVLPPDPEAALNAYLMRAFDTNQHLLEDAETIKPGQIRLYPESLAGPWSRATRNLWESTAKDLARAKSTALVGAEFFHPDGSYDNVIVGIGQGGGILYRQRMPVPVSMWRPWATLTANAHFTDPGIALVQGRRHGVLICYEQLLIWPALTSIANGAEILLAPANDWWAVNTTIPDIQQSSVAAWARLFGLPAIYAFNK